MRRAVIAGAAVSAMGLSACTSDPAVWEGIAMGLNQVAAEMEWENRNCYWAPPPGNPYGAVQQVCPGDWNYRQPVVVVTCAPRDRACDGHPDRRRRDHDRDRDRDRDRDDD